MNVALGAIILLFLILPGLSFRTGLIKSDSFENPLDTSLSGEVIITIILSIPFQIIGSLLLRCFNYQVDVYQFVLLISDASSDKIIIDEVNQYWKHFLIYILGLTLFGYFIGNVFRRFVFWKKLHLKYRFQKITNEWDDFFQGRNFNIKEDIEVSVDILQDTSSGTYIYSGSLDSYYLSRNNGLDKIILKNVFRRKIEHDKTNDNDDSRWYSLPGQHFIIEAEKIINIHIHYIEVRKQESE